MGQTQQNFKTDRLLTMPGPTPGEGHDLLDPKESDSALYVKNTNSTKSDANSAVFGGNKQKFTST